MELTEKTGSRIFLIGLLAILFVLLVFTTPVRAEETPFVVDFSANVTNGTAPLSVHFENLVTGNQVSGFWVINNETINQLPGPDYIFQVPGSYSVSLTVTDDTNTTLTETKPDYITVLSSISTTTISFTSTAMWGSNPVLITDNSSGEVVFVGKTSSKNIPLDSDGHYSVETLPGGITDIMNTPDYGISVVASFGSKNLIGLLIFSILAMIVIAIIFRRK
jgi:PKD repeat protein